MGVGFFLMVNGDPEDPKKNVVLMKQLITNNIDKELSILKEKGFHREAHTGVP